MLHHPTHMRFLDVKVTDFEKNIYLEAKRDLGKLRCSALIITINTSWKHAYIMLTPLSPTFL